MIADKLNRLARYKKKERVKFFEGHRIDDIEENINTFLDREDIELIGMSHKMLVCPDSNFIFYSVLVRYRLSIRGEEK